MKIDSRNLSENKINQPIYPKFDLFERTCRNGLSEIIPFKSNNVIDPEGWKFCPSFPPSYFAFGRMRALIALEEASALQPSRVLEIAAGGGGLSAALSQANRDIVVNDIRDEVIREAYAHYSIKGKVQIATGNLFDLKPESYGKFDLIIACEVIEHLAHPDDFLNHLKQFLTPGGRILITTPNGMFFRNKLPTYSEVKNFVELESIQFKPDADGHLFLFTPREIIRLGNSVGLELERLSVWGTPFITGNLGFRFVKGAYFIRIAYAAESAIQKFAGFFRNYICVAITALFRAESS